MFKSRIADLNQVRQNIALNTNLYKVSKPIYMGNNGYIFVLCDKRIAKLTDIKAIKLKNDMMDKQFLIFSEKFIKRLFKQADIVNFVNIKNIK